MIERYGEYIAVFVFDEISEVCNMGGGKRFM